MGTNFCQALLHAARFRPGNSPISHCMQGCDLRIKYQTCSMSLFTQLSSAHQFSPSRIEKISSCPIAPLENNAKLNQMAPKKLSGPNDEEWEANKSTLVRLYWTENRSVEDVGRIMKSEHEFIATCVACRTISHTRPALTPRQKISVLQHLQR